ncbi:MAG: ligase-associated DNA damage response DEXH box helicase [Bacteroidota bacterium]|nr:ligase-associated DNA damage response DEXH box helicase [Bacteroidota bacterium]MDX5429483.1 ligase-associated DNA damage response DEXH box helicase [Bacteroidota bacterium]MDX5468270.1 ligase-associated DNA damage response DEXH box helicase [Bacteroidota bacterium]
MMEAAESWFKSKSWTPQDFQRETWSAYKKGHSGLLNAPTGSGKTYALLLPTLLASNEKNLKGLRVIWISPIRALTKEIALSAERAIQGLGLHWTVGIRTGDTSQKERAAQKKELPNLLITTPESLHLMLAQKKYPALLQSLNAIIIDEWHELLGSKRGVLMELALSRLVGLCPVLQIWGISATIGNLFQAKDILLGSYPQAKEAVIIRANLKKEIEIETLIPDQIDTFPWAGHLGIRMIDQVIPILRNSSSTLIFTNTRSFAVVWYQKLLDRAPDLAGQIAMHHGSVSSELRSWVEDQLHQGNLKTVVCTSSLDLGVDFRPVETIIQIGSPKGVSRFLQRAGRSGHRPGETSKIYFVPTHSLEILEGAALREAVKRGYLEDRIPYVRSFDVLLQYLMTLAVSDGFYPSQVFEEVKQTFSFESVDQEEFDSLIHFLVNGGNSLHAYDEFHKLSEENGRFYVESRRLAMLHRMSIGTIVSDQMLQVKFRNGKRIGQVEEWFISQLKPGSVFWLAGNSLELVSVQGMDAIVIPAANKKGQVPSWMGGRMSFSSNLSDMLRLKMSEMSGSYNEVELQSLSTLFEKQKKESHVPHALELLIEKVQSDEGCHLFVFPFEGRFVNQAIASLLAYRLSLVQPFTFSIAINDYGFELLSDQDIPIELAIDSDMFSTDHLRDDLLKSLNATEMARRKFRDIARISGLIFQGYPGKPVKQRHLQSNAQLFFDVFSEHEPENLLLRQAYEEVMDFELEEQRLRKALQRIAKQDIIVQYPEKVTPFGFPILVDRIREKFTTETLQDRVEKMIRQLEASE